MPQKCIPTPVYPEQKHLKEKSGDYACLKDELARNLRLNFFEEAEIEKLLGGIDAFVDKKLSRKVAALCCQLSNTSSNLVERTLGHIRSAQAALHGAELETWLSRAFDLLDSSGLQQAVSFISKSGPDDLEKIFGNNFAVKLESVSSRLELYLKGISGMDFRVAASGLKNVCYTDSSTIYLPERLDTFCGPGENKNLLLYRLMAAHKWAQVAEGTLAPGFEGTSSLENSGYKKPSAAMEAEAPTNPLERFLFFAAFGDRDFALDLYNILEAIRLDSFLKKETPGLFEKAKSLRLMLLENRDLPAELSQKEKEKKTFIEGLFELYLAEGAEDAPYKMPSDEMLLPRKIWSEARKHRYAGESALAAFELCRMAADIFSFSAPGSYEPADLLFIGRLRPDEVAREEYARQLALQRKFEGIVAKIMEMPERLPEPATSGEKKRAPFKPPEPGKTYLLIRGKLIELEEEMLRKISAGGSPASGGVLVDGAAAGGRHVYRLSDLFDLAGKEEPPGASVEKASGLKYDEWDYRRGGYRKGWCTLYEQDVHAGHGPFVEQTLKRYGGYVTALRNKFELLRREPRLLRRQMDGEDIDMDAMVEALADMKAGLLPSGEDLFVRYERKERDIAALFLLDMSGSTKGWVNQAEKESVVLMCEALQALGDRYAIYGFSGMTRGRCDFYRIKSFEEVFGPAVKKRIAGIDPKDYTRMGPAIRHANSILEKTGAKTRLLIVLSDGKPEDYDAYKGDYGVEDTRKALMEARERGVHPFCITIDKEARSYLPRMYGAANYILIDNVRKLPGRIPEIYRRLTA
ncbi:MAG: VWA domain-containing protein [Nitrospiraceae bacterium]|nr:VWA domain-containing protein [Nitrospiraceae bacterium]